MKQSRYYDHLHGIHTERASYEMNIENWAAGLMELEEASTLAEEIPKTTFNGVKSQLPVATPSYYRSKAFTNTVGINKLITAADPMLTLATKLRKVKAPADPALLHQNLCHEIKAFENKAQTLGYNSQLVLAARYALCALLDELITLNLWEGVAWKPFLLIETFHKEVWDNDRFFLILERSLQDPAAHLDLLELMYVCLRFGYEGKYRGIERGHFELVQITDHLYHCIKHYRDEFSRNLLVAIETPTHHSFKESYFHLFPPTWLVSTLMIIFLMVTFCYLYLDLVETSLPITQFLNTLTVPTALTTH